MSFANPRITLNLTCPVSDPAASDLYIRYLSGYFDAYLTYAIPSTAISISSLYVNGFSGGSCGFLEDSDQLIGTVVISAGGVAGSTQGSSPMGCNNTDYIMTNSADINSTNRTNGQTITVGGTTVTVHIVTTCTSYPC